MKLKIFKKRYVYRSAKTGEFVSRLYALLHPGTTIKEKVQ
jgi:hypothetical protein